MQATVPAAKTADSSAIIKICRAVSLYIVFLLYLFNLRTLFEALLKMRARSLAFPRSTVDSYGQEPL
jgi:hypothetical protein